MISSICKNVFTAVRCSHLQHQLYFLPMGLYVVLAASAYSTLSKTTQTPDRCTSGLFCYTVTIVCSFATRSTHKHMGLHVELITRCHVYMLVRLQAKETNIYSEQREGRPFSGSLGTQRQKGIQTQTNRNRTVILECLFL